MKTKSKKQFIVVEHCGGTHVQKAGVNYMYSTHDAAVQSIIDSLMDNEELEDDGSTTDKYNIHLPGSKYRIKNDKEISKRMKNCDSLIVGHNDYEVRYDIIELIM